MMLVKGDLGRKMRCGDHCEKAMVMIMTGRMMIMVVVMSKQRTSCTEDRQKKLFF